MDFAQKVYPDVEIVSVTSDNPRHRYTYKQAFARTRKLANALVKLGAKSGDAIATMAWNDYRHLELYYGISCSGMVCHTINPRLFPEQIEYIINHAEDKWLFIDPLFVPLLEKLQPALPTIKGYIVLTDEANMPTTSLLNAISYEALIIDESEQFEFPLLDEDTACSLCYTSGTTGNPKGVVYSHRSTVLHCYASCLPDAFALSRNDVTMPIVPMFHVNGWGIVYGAPMCGVKLVMPGAKMADGETLCDLINSEGITCSAGVPTVWLALLQYLEKSGKSVDSLQRVTVGGAACPLSIFEQMKEKYDVDVEHAWGMTEMSPLGTYNKLSEQERELPKDQYNTCVQRQGFPIFGADLRIVDQDGQEIAWDGETSGSVQVRGPFITKGYYKEASSNLKDGWFETGDVAYMDKDSRMQITDRTKDIIKSGGEWISSIELENCAVNHPKIVEAAVIGINHEKWTERPLLIAIKQDGASLTAEELLQWMEGKVAKWWIPDSCVFVDSLPHTATGKLSKKDLRVTFKDFNWQ